MANSHHSAPMLAHTIHFLSVRTVTSPEDQEAGRKRYCGIAKADEFFALDWDENVRGYLGLDEDGKKRKSTLVNLAIRKTLEENPDLFPLLNSGLVIVSRACDVDDNRKIVRLQGASIINGAQTQGVLKEYYADHEPSLFGFPSVNFELIVTDDDELIADISISRNFQNRVADLSIYGRYGLFDELEKSLKRHNRDIRLRKAETDFGDEFIDTEKLVQVITALAPPEVPLPSAEKRAIKTAETLYRVYAYRHRSRCLKDFAEVMQDPAKWGDAHAFFLDVAWEGWKLYQGFRAEQSFSSLHKVEGERVSGKKVVMQDGVPDGIVFPMLSTLSRFVKKGRSGWSIDIPKSFPWPTLYRQVRTQYLTTADHNPQTMGKNADCYVALHGVLDMYFDVVGTK